MVLRLAKITVTSLLLLVPLTLFAVPASNAPSIRFLVLTDIHFDPYASCRSPKQAPCALVKKLRAASAEEWPQLLAAANVPMSDYRQNTNYKLLVSTLTEARQAAAAKQISFVAVLGDLIAHEFRHDYKIYAQDNTRAGYEAFVRKTITFVSNELGSAFPRWDVYMLAGNNDSYHRDYYVNPHGLFYSQMGSLWSGLIKNGDNRAIMRREFSKVGYYAVNLPADPSLRLIMLNSVLFSNKAQGTGVDKAAAEQLQWLHQQLEAARNNHQTVFIAMHIPDGIDVYTSLRIRLIRIVELWRPEYADRFQSELREFASQIGGLFAGHLHANWMHMLRFEHLNDIPFIGTASVSPIYGNDPGFSIYQYSPTTSRLDGVMTYHYPLNVMGGWKLSSQPNEAPYVYQMV